MRCDDGLNSAAGFALVEILVAMAILSVAVLGFANRLDATIDAMKEVATRERMIATADRVMTAWSLLSAADLDQRLGHTREGEFVISVERPELHLYRISVAAADHPSGELLVSIVFRPNGGSI